MSVQNLVSASITAQTKDEVLRSIADIRAKLGFLLNLQASEVVSLVKAGKEFVPFIDTCHAVTKSHPEILSGVFDKTEFDNDYQLSKDLAEIAESLAQLNEGVSHTLTAARSDALVASLDVYSAVKSNKSKVAGLNSVADTLGKYFQKQPKTAAPLAK